MGNRAIHIMRIIMGLSGIVGFIGCVAIDSGWWVGACSMLCTFRCRNVNIPQFLDWIFNIMMLSGFVYCTLAFVLSVDKKNKSRLFYVLLALSIILALIPSVWSYSIAWEIKDSGVKEILKPLLTISMPLTACIFCPLNELFKRKEL